jgi:hypothetical protein
MEVKAVENLWMIGEFPVDGWTAKSFFCRGSSQNRGDAHSVCAFAIRFA